MAVDIGSEATDRGSTIVAGNTYVLKDNPASESGTITSIEIWAVTNMANLVVGTFYTTNGNVLKCRDSEAIAGVIYSGSKVIKEVTITVEAGDYIGAYWTVGILERDVAGYAGYWVFEGESIDPNDEETFISLDNYTMSIGGHLPAVAAGRAFGFIIG